ncbi:hypothetical protein [Thiolapillus sp.]|uniref:hypothetical protein n=1 Tax=Thiolapillus sp. TaxID=2017437 RepID=UPI003AF8802F
MNGDQRIVSLICHGLQVTGDAAIGLGVRCQPWRAKRRLVDPSSREAALFSRRALRQRENKGNYSPLR